MKCLNAFFSNLKICILDATSRIKDFNGRSSRREFRYVFGVYCIVMTTLTLAMMFYAYRGVDFSDSNAILAANETANILSVGIQLIGLLCFVVVLPLMIRRFQDTDRSATICKLMFVYNFIAMLIYLSSLYSITYIHQIWYMLMSFSIINLLVLVINLYMYAILLFAKGSEGRNEYGLPSCALVKHTVAG